MPFYARRLSFEALGCLAFAVAFSADSAHAATQSSISSVFDGSRLSARQLPDVRVDLRDLGLQVSFHLCPPGVATENRRIGMTSARCAMNHCIGMQARRRVIALLFAVLAAGPALAADPVVVNGQALPLETVRALEQAYRVPIAPGRYWYDPFSGAWGIEGGPIGGQMMPGLRLGGALRADASRGNTQVFINGRELTMGEVVGLQQACRTAVYRGRYWVNAQGIGGIEGGPPIFSLAACGSSSGKSGGSSTRTYCDDAGNCSSHGLWGWISTAR